MGGLTISLQLLVAASYLLRRRPGWADRALARASLLGERHTRVALAILLGGLYAIAWLTTPQIDFGRGAQGLGYGHDGRIYGWMTEHFAWFRERTVPPYNYRPLVPFLVHVSGLSTFTGYRLVNAVSHVLCGLLVYALACRFTASRSRALVAVALFGTLKFGLKFWLYYPVLTDAPGMALLLAVVYCTLARHRVGYLVAMAAAVFCRENLMPLMGFHVLHAIRTERGLRARLGALALQAVPIALFVLSRRWPVFAPDRPMRLGIGLYFWALFLWPWAAPRALLAHASTLGLLFVLPALRWRAWATSLWREYEWGYFFLTTLFLTFATGLDIDRFTMWEAPLLVAAVARLPSVGAAGPRGWLWLHLLALHAVGTQFLLPWAPSEPFYMSLYAVYATGPALAVMAVSGALTAALAALMVGTAGRSTPRTS